MQEQMSGAAMAMPADTNKAFKVYSAVLAVISVGLSFAIHWSLVISGWVGGAGADRSSVGAGERRGGSNEQRAGFWRHVQQGAADWHLLTLRRQLNCGHCRDLFFGSEPQKWDTSLYVMQSLQYIYIQSWFMIVILDSSHSFTGFNSMSSMLDSLASPWRYFGMFVFVIVKMHY